MASKRLSVGGFGTEQVALTETSGVGQRRDRLRTDTVATPIETTGFRGMPRHVMAHEEIL